ncbi:MAG: hypothetical protein RIB58_04545 [Phycisphaerales bacterium]
MAGIARLKNERVSVYRQLPVSSIAGCLGMAAFAVAIVSGLGAGQETDTILWRAFLSSIMCYIFGLIVGIVAQRAIDDALGQYRAARPAPELAELDGSAESGGASTPARAMEAA